jgi:hypothetical protein
MAERSVQKKLVYEGMAGRYRTLMLNTRDPARRRMLEEMIVRELEAARRRADGAIRLAIVDQAPDSERRKKTLRA